MCTRYRIHESTAAPALWTSAPPCRSTFRHVRPASVLPFPSQSSEVPARNLLSPFLLSFRRAEWISDRLSTTPVSRTNARTPKMGKNETGWKRFHRIRECTRTDNEQRLQNGINMLGLRDLISTGTVLLCTVFSWPQNLCFIV